MTGDLRVRHFGELARVELSADELPRWSSGTLRERLEAAVVAVGYERVDIDPRGFRSGAMISEHEQVQAIAQGARPTDSAHA